MMSVLKKIVLFPISLFVALLALMAKWLKYWLSRGSNIH